ncbi:PQQ-binding-like beta-propeller repeat protein [Streptomyces cinereoruber]|uniref:outer membrane protein assembly factor BamB family protein n=1 Tax=Streptomyces cinereoruber TaxID=67260 RepID=UPI003EBD33C4
MGERVGDVRRDGTAAPRTWRSALGGLAALGVLSGIVVGLGWVFLGPTGYWPGSSMTTVWEAPSDGRAPEDGVHRAWLAGDTLVRARYDAVTGFDAGSGGKRWEFVPPRRTDICAAGEAADDGRVLIAHTGGADGGCSVVVALGLADGRELWRAPLAPADGDALATGGGLGVALDAGTGKGAPAVRALDLRTGSPRWTAAVPRGCAPVLTGVAPRQVVAVLACGEELKLAAFDPADGRERWTTSLDERDGVSTGARVTLAATDPVVLRVDEGDRGVDAFLVFGPDGRPGARIQSTGDGYGTIGPHVAVSDGRLFALTDGGPWGRLVAFDLTTGGELWQDDGVGGAAYVVQGLHAEAGRVMAVSGSGKYGDHLYVFDAATGDEEEDRAFRDDVGSLVDLLPYRDRIIAVRSGGRAKPFSAYERW